MNRTTLLFLTLFFYQSSFSQVNLNDGLVAYYPFNGNASDASGNANHGTPMNGVQLTQDRFGNANNAYFFDGVDDFISIPNSASLNPSNALSITLYFKPARNGLQNLIGKIASTGGVATQYQMAMDFNLHPGVLFGVNPIASGCAGVPLNSAYVNTGSPVGVDQWHCIVGTFDNGIQKIYLNGVLIETLNTGFTTLNQCVNATIQIGKWWNGDPLMYQGVIDEIRIYNRALNQDEVNSLCLSQQPCNNWLYLPSQPSYVNIGDLDVPGTSITVEANFNTILNNNGFGDLVAKHQGSADVNYLLRPYSGEITTSNGYFRAITFCPVEPHKIYHAAMVYDGSTLKFYRNGFLMAQVPATGTLFQNNWQTWIGYYQPQALPENFIGYINEVRVWNVARSQSDIIANMNASLPNPTTQPGLLAYYVFNDLTNKQGNPVWDGILGGSASINGASSACQFFRDSCEVTQGAISGIINDYTPVTGFDICKNIVSVEDATAFNVGDTVLMIQMKGAIIDSTNSASFGTIINSQNSGNYEFNYIKSKSGNEVELLNTLLKSYDIPEGRVQMIRVPYYQKAIINAPLTCLPWDGRKGGVLVLNSQDSVILYSDIDVTGKGFRGGIDPFSNPSSFFCNENQFYYPANQDIASQKGEGIAEVSDAKSFGRGALANGGGGGNSHNSGGGGGGNIATGGTGGYQYEGVPCNTTVPFDNRGLGGKSLAYSNVANKIFMGGGGGAGQSNNAEGFQSNGGTGSGIVIIIADKLKSNGNKIVAKGNAANACPVGGTGCHEGMGGGGAGGTTLLNINTYIDNANIDTRGGKGGDMTTAGFLKVGPGGGGGGGIQWFSVAGLPGNVTTINTGGQNGVATAYSNDPWGATPGNTGSNLFNLQIPFANTLFRTNIDSVRIKDSITSCNSFDFNGQAYTNTNPVSTWEWFFGDGGTANTQNTAHTYLVAGTFPVKLVITDINGCKDSITKNVTASILTMDAGPQDTICAPNSTILQATQNGGLSYSWTPSAFLNDATLLNPIASPPTTTMFTLSITAGSGCVQKDSVLITVRAAANFTIDPAISTCTDEPVQLMAGGGDVYAWTPAGSLDNAAIANPWANPTATTVYSVQITDTLCNNTGTLTTTVTVLPLPDIIASKSNDLNCTVNSSQLTASGGSTYSWSPATTLDNPATSNPVATPVTTTQYVVTGTDVNGCSNKDSVIVNVSNVNPGQFLMPNAFTPNFDGKNDCFGIKYWGTIQELEFNVYNRWGEKIFQSKDPAACWDGTYKGMKQPPGAYVYWIRARTSCVDKVFRKGTVILIR